MIEDLIKKISSSSGLSDREIKEKIIDKQTELSGLISDEGAAYIVAKELGVQLLREQEKLNIENVIPGMQNVDVIGRIINISGIRAFSTERAKGRVLNLTIADTTGSIRLSLWNEEIDKIKDFAVGSIVRVRGYVKEDNLGAPEIRLGRFGSLQKTSADLPPIEELAPTERRYERVKIADLKENQNGEIRAALLQAFETNMFFPICPDCGQSMKEGKCKEHGIVEPNYGLILTGIVDDGSESIRAVFFNENAEKILDMSKEEAKRIFDEKRSASVLLENIQLGKDLVFEGRVRRNKYFDRLEFVVNNVKNIDAKREIELML